MTTMMLERMPVLGYRITQEAWVNATAGVVADPNGTTVQQLVAKYGDYQPHGHNGIDIGCPMRTLVFAPGAGRVDWAGWSQDMPKAVADKYAFYPGDESGGICVLIDHGNGLLSALLHLDQTDLNTGDWLQAGSFCGWSGTTGMSGGPHLHWSVIVLAMIYVTRTYGRVDPLDHLPAGQLIPIGGGATGGADIGPRYLLGLNGIPIPRQ